MPLRRSFPFLAAAVAVGGLVVPAAAFADASATVTASGYSPAVVTVKRGAVVTWTNDDTAAHSVTSDDGATMKSGLLEPGQSFATLFEKAGTFRYRSTVTGDTMRGTVIVKPGPLPTATGPTPPTGTVPGGFSPKPGAGPTATSTSAADNADGGVDALGVAGGAAFVLLAIAGVGFLVWRRAGQRSDDPSV